MTQKDKRPDSSRLISSFDDPHAAESFTGDRTIPDQYSALSDMSDHGHMSAFDSELSDLMDPTLDTEFADRTQTDLTPMPDVHEDEAQVMAQERMDTLLLDCLEVLDDFDSLLESARAHEDSAELAEVIKGMEAARKRFLDKLGKNHGIEHQPAVGAPPDPSRHEIVREVDSDKDGNGTVVAVEREGYARHGQPLRRARVVVSKKKA